MERSKNVVVVDGLPNALMASIGNGATMGAMFAQSPAMKRHH